MDAREIDMHALGERIQAARGSRDWNQTQLAAKAGLSQPTVSRIEKGQRPVTLVEADAVARALEIPLDTLLYGSGVAERVLVALRVAESSADRATAVGPGVELLELDERLDAVLAEYRQESHSAPVRPRRAGSPTTVGARLAFDLRQELQLGAAPITELPELIEEVTGVDVATRPLPGISGMCLDDPARDTRLLVVNSDEPAERQRFTLAHELGHLLFGDGAHVDDLDEEDRESETRCHEFARNLLLPPEGVTGWLKRNTGATSGPVDEQIVSRLARYFGVSSEVVKIQLERMGLRPDRPVLSTPTLAARYGWRAEYDAEQAAARRPRPPRRLAQRAAAAYARGLVGAAVVARLEGRPVAEVEAERNELESPVPPTSARRRSAGLVSVDDLLARAASRRP